jgi:hypothetical protein
MPVADLLRKTTVSAATIRLLWKNQGNAIFAHFINDRASIACQGFWDRQ